MFCNHLFNLHKSTFSVKDHTVKFAKIAIFLFLTLNWVALFIRDRVAYSGQLTEITQLYSCAPS